MTTGPVQASIQKFVIRKLNSSVSAATIFAQLMQKLSLILKVTLLKNALQF